MLLYCADIPLLPRNDLSLICFGFLEQERVKASQGQGKLGKQLDAQKAQTQNQSLVQSARDNAAAREADAAAQARNYN